MRLEFRAVRHVNGARRDVIDGGEAIVAKRRKIRPGAKQPAIGSQRRKRDREQVGKLLQQRATVRLSSRETVVFEVRLSRTGPRKRNGGDDRWHGFVDRGGGLQALSPQPLG